MMLKAIVKTTKSLIRAIFRAYRKGKIDRGEIAVVARDLVDLILDELDEMQPRNSSASELLSDMRYRIGQIQERMGRG
jgi:hypothetical protein